MALTLVNNPSFDGFSDVAQRVNNHLAFAAFQKPVWDEVLFHQDSRWYLSSFFETYFDEDEPIAANEVNWAEDGKIYSKQTVSATPTVENGAGSGNFTLTLDQTDQYFIPNDVVMTGVVHPTRPAANILLRIASVGTAGPNQTITGDLVDTSLQGVTLPAAFATATELQLIYNSRGECWNMSPGRRHTPAAFSNQMVKIDDTYDTCDDAYNQLIWFYNTQDGEFYWEPEESFLELGRHRMKKDLALLFGDSHTFTETIGSSTYAGTAGQGLLTFLSGGSYIRSYAGTYVEDDSQEFLSGLGRYSKYNEWYALCGRGWKKDFNKAHAAYYQNASIHFGRAREDGDTIGINVGKYYFGDDVVNVMEYAAFSDPDLLPSNAGGFDYNDFAMWINRDPSSIRICYKKRKLGGKVREWLSRQIGPTFQESGGRVDTDQACYKMNVASHVTIKVKGVQNHGLVYKA